MEDNRRDRRVSRRFFSLCEIQADDGDSVAKNMRRKSVNHDQYEKQRRKAALAGICVEIWTRRGKDMKPCILIFHEERKT